MAAFRYLLRAGLESSTQSLLCYVSALKAPTMASQGSALGLGIINPWRALKERRPALSGRMIAEGISQGVALCWLPSRRWRDSMAVLSGGENFEYLPSLSYCTKPTLGTGVGSGTSRMGPYCAS